MEVPMLDEDEFASISKLYSQGFQLTGKSLKVRFEPLCKAYLEITGFNETNPNAIMHHRISLYGPKCRNCGKPFRTPKASFCASCGSCEAVNPN